jgi:hypothetical protein
VDAPFCSSTSDTRSGSVYTVPGVYIPFWVSIYKDTLCLDVVAKPAVLNCEEYPTVEPQDTGAFARKPKIMRH